MTAMQTVTSVIIGFKVLSLFLGGFITYLSYKAYRRNHARALGALALGFGIITAGTFIAGVFDQLFEAGFRTGQLIESSLVALGFLVILYSLYTTHS